MKTLQVSYLKKEQVLKKFNETLGGLRREQHTFLHDPNVLWLQVCYHTGSKTDPDQRDRQTDRSDVDILRRFVARCMPGLVPEPAVVESCMYTVQTPDRGFTCARQQTDNKMFLR